ncbi:MAG TPA: alpha-L-rhamnosidase N-terminal domain-containing protein, partial [Actinospica sp.]|nr:alpha-L-rhamnosidase N-terminal domain-containing protein [Actinospica sp.]
MRVEHHEEPLGIGEARPRLSWRIAAGPRDWMQTEYEIRVRDERNGREVGRVRRETGESVLVPWPVESLRSRQRVGASVRVWGRDGEGPSPWSEPLMVEAGLLGPHDWTAALVSPMWPQDDARPFLLRGSFLLRGPVASARVYATAHGVYEAEINGVRVGDHVLAPGWTHYPRRLRYQTYDVTGLLRPGENAAGVLLADGWFRGRIGFGGGRRAIYGDRLAALVQIEVRYADGTTEVFGTDA